MGRTKISWSEMSWNVIAGCTKVSDGCTRCYAERMAHRLAGIGQFNYQMVTTKGKWNGIISTNESALEIPLHWKKPRRIFVNSMSDTFHEKVPFEFIDKIFAVMALCPQHCFQILTKRPEKCRDWINLPNQSLVIMDAARKIAKGKGAKLMNEAGVICWPLPNLWLGVTCENREMADKRIPLLLQVLAAKRFVSFEPLLEEIKLPLHCQGSVFWAGLSQVIIGCESGPHRRETKLEWVKSLIEQADSAAVAVFVKQLEINGKVSHNMNDWPKWAQRQEYPK